MKTKLLFDRAAKDKLISGVKILSDAVTTTLGPRGQNVAISKADPHGNIYERIVLHDGVSVAKSIDLSDEFENMGAQLLREAAQKQVMSVGDGTTVTVALARSIIEEANALVVAGMNPMELRRKIELSVQTLIKEIKRLSIPVTTFDQKKYIATVSAEDPDLGELVAKTVSEMGVEGVVAVEEGRGLETTVEKQIGMQLEKGFMHSLFVTNPARAEAVVEDPYILVTDKSFDSLQPIAEVAKAIANQGRGLVVIAPSFGQAALELMLQNKIKGALPSLAIAPGSFGTFQSNILLDIAIMVGATFISKDAGHKFEDVDLDYLGHAEYVQATKESSIIVGGRGKKKDIQERIKGIKASIAKEEDDYEQEKLKERLAKLTSGIAVIRAGGATEIEMKERLERIKDAVEATKAAMLGGIVPGGEVIYLLAREKLDKKDLIVAPLMYRALFKPFAKLLSNAGLDPGEMYARLENHDKNDGVDVTDGKIKDLVKSGIIDPAMVSIEALTNAASVAVQILSVSCMIVPEVKDEK